ncbi:MAG: hypothetical protein H6812_08845 [Phycisphaeraceae bacterium]|nr:hypothetical protein [Phycisphaeraceae bacterium]
MESNGHRRLKLLAAAFLRRNGFRAVAPETRLPGSRALVDIAGYYEGHAGGEPSSAPLFTWKPAAREKRVRCTAVIECKFVRSDFLRERHDLPVLLAKRDALEVRRREFERGHLREREPELQQSGSFLFEEMESWDFGNSRSTVYQRVLRELADVSKRIHGHSKFSTLAHRRLADRLYVIAPASTLAPRDVPLGWGLLCADPRALERDDARDWFEDAERPLPVTIHKRAPIVTPTEWQRQRTLRAIAFAASRDLWKVPPEMTRAQAEAS